MNKNKLYAIYKNELHKGNERGKTKCEAIQNYVVASMFEEFLNEKEFMGQYSAILAVEEIHYN